jgi:hypothetical protein
MMELKGSGDRCLSFLEITATFTLCLLQDFYWGKDAGHPMDRTYGYVLEVLVNSDIELLQTGSQNVTFESELFGQC